MSVSNLKWVALFVQMLLGGSQNFEIGSRDPGHAHLGVILLSICLSSISVPNLKRTAQFIQVIKGVPKLGHVTQAMPI